MDYIKATKVLIIAFVFVIPVDKVLVVLLWISNPVVSISSSVVATFLVTIETGVAAIKLMKL